MAPMAANHKHSRSYDRSLSPGESIGSFGGSLFSPLKRTAKINFMPRDGPTRGGGTLTVHERIFDTKEVQDDPRQGSRGGGQSRRPHSVQAPLAKSSVRSMLETRKHLKSAPSASTGSLFEGMTGSVDPYAEDDDSRPARLGPDERRFVEISTKLRKVEDIRARDMISIRDRVEKGKDEREARAKRLLESVCGHGVAFEAAMELRRFEADQERKRYDHHLEWDEKVYQPVASKAFERMNVDRQTQQWVAGSKSVGFELPAEPFRLTVNVAEDPSRRDLLKDWKEKAFHEDAESFLAKSRSAPCLRNPLRELQARGNTKLGGVIPSALSKPVLEPTFWCPVKLPEQMGGRFSQACEAGKSARRLRRGGSNIHIPDESDNVPTAGTRMSRVFGARDIGVLRELSGPRGESYDYNNGVGGSSAAPAQDHYTYDRGTAVIDLEFPLGKKIFPQFH